MIVLEIVLGVLVAGAIVFYLACALLTLKFFRAKAVNPSPSPPPVSILVPVCGLDPGAWENWSSLCTQNYPNYEVVFGVKDVDDPAIPTLKKLVETFPKHTRLRVDLPARGINHKDSNLSYLLELVKHEVIIFVDSDIRVHANYIHTVVTPLADPRVGLVTCAFIGRQPQSLGAALASLGRCVDFIPSALIAQIMDGGLKFAVGVTMATRKETLMQAGGLHMSRIGSDYNLGKRIAQAGYRVMLSRYVLESDTGTEGIASVFRRELRWARTIRFNRGAQYYTMIFCYGTVCSTLLLLASGFAPWAIALTVATFSIRYLQAVIAALAMQAPKLLLWLWAIPLRDCLSVGIWLAGAYGRKVYWRGRQLLVEGDGLIRPWPK